MARGQGKHSLLDRCRKDKTCPKITEIFGSTEFWDLHASLDFVGIDAPRRYSAAGQCAALLQCRRSAQWRPRRLRSGRRRRPQACVLSSNPNPASDTSRAVFAGLVDWVTKGTEPPASIYPTLASGGLITPAAYDKAFPKIRRCAAPGLFAHLSV